MRLFSDHLLTASGRVGRAVFCPTAFVLIGLGLGLGHVARLGLPAWITLIPWLGLAYLGLCLVNQRLHDIGRSGWWAGPLLLIGLVLAHLDGKIGHGLLPLAVSLLAALLSLIPGSRGHNRYGPRP